MKTSPDPNRRQFIVTAAAASLAPTLATASPKRNTVRFTLRERKETAMDTGMFHTLRRQEHWNPAESAIVVCDMWDLHHCLNATRRGGELAPRMNEVIKAARKLGFTTVSYTHLRAHET